MVTLRHFMTCDDLGLHCKYDRKRLIQVMDAINWRILPNLGPKDRFWIQDSLGMFFYYEKLFWVALISKLKRRFTKTVSNLIVMLMLLQVKFWKMLENGWNRSIQVKNSLTEQQGWTDTNMSLCPKQSGKWYCLRFWSRTSYSFRWIYKHLRSIDKNDKSATRWPKSKSGLDYYRWSAFN